MVDFYEDQNSIYWWRRKIDVHTAVCGAAKAILENQRHRRSRNVSLLGLFSRIDPLTAAGGMAGFMNVFQMRHLPKINLNIINNMANAVASKVTKNKPKPTFLTKGGNYSNKKKAQQLEKFAEGLFYQTDAYALGAQAFLDCTVFDIGGLKVYESNGEIKIERVYPNEILVDDGDAFYGKPSQLHQYKKVPRESLLAQYPSKRGIIEQAGDAIDPEAKERVTLADTVSVVESWHLPENGKGGRHTICLDSGCLEDNSWDLDCFPFVFIKWSERLAGFYGMPLAEHLQGLQLEIEKVLTEMQMGLHLSKPMIVVDRAAKINKHHIQNDLGVIIETDDINGIKPFTPQAYNEDAMRHLEWIYQRAYEIAGISQLSAQSRKPPGLNSGVAIQEFHDIESERFYMVGRAYEDMYMDLSKLLIKMAKRVYKKEGKFEVKLAAGKAMEIIDWGDIDLDEDSYIMQVYPTGFLPTTPSGKLEFIERLIALGVIENREQLLELLDFPDTEKFVALATVDLNIIDKSIERMLDPDEPEYVPPEPFMNLELALKRSKSAYLHAKEENAEELQLDLLRRFMTECMDLIAMAQPPTPPAGALPPEGMPPEGDTQV